MTDASETPPEPHVILLEPGAQLVINGALVTAIEGCTLEVSAGAHVVTGRALRRTREALHHPSEELYFSMLDAGTSETRFVEARPRLFHLLSHVVANARTRSAQQECSICAAAMMTGDRKAAISSAARLVSARLGTSEAHRANTGDAGSKAPMERRQYPGLSRPLRIRP